MKDKIAYRVRFCWYFLIIIWFRTLRLFGYTRNTDKIPFGPYCYTPDIEKNKQNKDWTVYYMIPCPYFLSLKNMWSGCSYCGFFGWDIAHWDQCKICSARHNDQCPECGKGEMLPGKTFHGKYPEHISNFSVTNYECDRCGHQYSD